MSEPYEYENEECDDCGCCTRGACDSGGCPESSVGDSLCPCTCD